MYLCLYTCSIDGEITYESQMKLIRDSFDEVSNASDVVLCEGTGHCAVGSIVNVNNAKVASMLGASMLLIANGGLGEFLFSSFRLFVVIAHNRGDDYFGTRLFYSCRLTHCDMSFDDDCNGGTGSAFDELGESYGHRKENIPIMVEMLTLAQHFSNVRSLLLHFCVVNAKNLIASSARNTMSPF
jgi:hypothetical protein